MYILTKTKNLLLDILFPPICINCKKFLEQSEKENSICNLCFSKINIHTTLFCGKCRARLPENKKICHKDAVYLLGAATDYNEEIKNLIHVFKYQSWTRIKKPLEQIINCYLKNLWLEKPNLTNFIIIPIPLHKTRKQERGFNQAELLGEIIAEKLQLPLKINVLIKTKETKSQAELKDWEKRKENLRESFMVQQPEQIKDKNIILIDDVYTSGATINEAAKTLRDSGARKILALVIAKTK